MKGSLLLILFLINYVFSQKMPEDYLNEANDYFYEGKYDKALENYIIIITEYPKFPEYPFALYNMGILYEKTGNENKAEQMYLSIIDRSFDNNILITTQSIMENPYANFSFNSCINLAALYYKNNEYTKALEYYILADTSNLYTSFCGNAVSEKRYFLKRKIAECYLKQNEVEKAIQTLIKEVFGNGLSSNSDIIDLLIKIVNKKYSNETIKQKLNKSINNIYLKDNKYFLKLFGEEIYIYDINKMFLRSEITKEEAIEIIYENKFFKNYFQ